jgi:hypothetical protein
MQPFDRDHLARVFHGHAQITREQIFGPNDPIPLHLRDDAAVMFAGYVGRRYRAGAPVLLAINPGGGGDAYRNRTAEDERLYPLLHEFRVTVGDSVPRLFEEINATFADIVSHWNLMRILAPVIGAAGAALDEVAYLNAVPYRTRGDKVPSVYAKGQAWRSIVRPTLSALRPGFVIALGKKAGDVLDRFHLNDAPSFVVPRTIGDSYLSDEACAVIERIRMQRQRQMV